MRHNLAAVNRTNGDVLPWNPSPNGAVAAIGAATFVLTRDQEVLTGWLLYKTVETPFMAAVVKGTKFDVVVSDIEMPGMNGFELAEAIRADARTAQIPIIALSSITSPATIERGRQAGFHDFVAKFDRQGLIAALKESTVEWSEAA